MVVRKRGAFQQFQRFFRNRVLMHDFSFVHDIRAVKADKGIDAERLRIVLKIIRRPPGCNKYIDAALLQLCNRLDRILRNFLLFINKCSVNVEKTALYFIVWPPPDVSIYLRP